MRRHILLVKTSSLGDVVHALPAISDLRAARPADVADWVVEDSFAAIPRLHPGVASVLPVAIRRWRRTWWRRATRAEIAHSMRRLRARNYDAVVDVQGLFKSAAIALVARGPRFGFDWRSSREPLGLFYQHTYNVPWSLHAVERNRMLLARAMGYTLPARCDYGIRASPCRFSWLGPRPYAVLLHATSGDDKLWPEERWIALGGRLAQAGVDCVLPWGNAREHRRSERIAAGVRGAIVAPALTLDELAGVLAGTRVAIGVDTGLTHFAAALGVPTAGIYCATDPAATGIYGCARAVNVGGPGKLPTVAELGTAVEHLMQAAC